MNKEETVESVCEEMEDWARRHGSSFLGSWPERIRKFHENDMKRKNWLIDKLAGAIRPQDRELYIELLKTASEEIGR